MALIKGKPVQLNLKKYLNYFLEFREETIRKRTYYFLKNTLEKLEISEGLRKATKNIKKVIEIIEESENSVEAKSKLIKKFFLSNKQANSVLDMPLRKLTKLAGLKNSQNLLIQARLMEFLILEMRATEME